jgi:hypothetical protein
MAQGFMAQGMLKQFWLAVALFAAPALMVQPAAAQFGAIFNDDPPRPPGSVPSGAQPPAQEPYYAPTYRQQAPQRMPQQLPQQTAPADLGRGGEYQSGVEYRRPYDARADQPPERPSPPPMSLPPTSRPGAGSIQSQPLAPPPGAQSAPPAAAPLQPIQPLPGSPQQDATRAPAQPGQGQTLPGLPPGIRQPPGTPQPADTSPQPGDEVVVAPPPQRIANPTAVFSGLDKITGRIISFDVAINETVQFGALQVTPKVCYSRPPTETPNTDAFVQVDEVTLTGEIKRIFEGWMFAASPGLHAVEHPIYDVWITDCKGGSGPDVADAKDDASEAKPSARAPVPQRRPQ